MEGSAALAQTSSIAELNRKIDRLTSQVEFLTEEALRQKRRQQEWDELIADLTPISKEAFNLVSEQLAEVEECARLDNVLHLVKRLLRNTCAMGAILEQMESLMDFWQDFSPLTRGVVLALMTRLDEMERKGYFTFLQAMLDGFDRVVGSFSAEELRQLSNNIAPLVEIAKEVTQPEVVELLHRSVVALKDGRPGAPSLFALLRQMNDWQARRGLGRLVHVLKAVGE